MEEAKCSLLLVSTANSYFSVKSFVFSLSKQADLKVQSVRRLGKGRLKKYFFYLSRLLSLKLSKV
ncbi:hypothetical protein CFP56_000517 [Quercus suber]|uniref:Uncharacterized protein n=1 Tax=Quercus suber TaxID=58331 RepID=A0AAW0LFU8_QUESU